MLPMVTSTVGGADGLSRLPPRSPAPISEVEGAIATGTGCLGKSGLSRSLNAAASSSRGGRWSRSEVTLEADTGARFSASTRGSSAAVDEVSIRSLSVADGGRDFLLRG